MSLGRGAGPWGRSVGPVRGPGLTIVYWAAPELYQAAVRQGKIEPVSAARRGHEKASSSRWGVCPPRADNFSLSMAGPGPRPGQLHVELTARGPPGPDGQPQALSGPPTDSSRFLSEMGLIGFSNFGGSQEC